MNVDNIQKTIESLKTSTSYTQDRYFHDCNTPACIAGHACFDASAEGLINDETSLYAMTSDKITDIACDWFGIESHDPYEEYTPGICIAHDMFTQNPLRNRPAIREEAIAMLENFIETGEVNWNIYLEKASERRLSNEY